MVPTFSAWFSEASKGICTLFFALPVSLTLKMPPTSTRSTYLDELWAAE